MSPSVVVVVVVVSKSFQPSESPVSIQPLFLMFLASLWVVLEVYFFVWPNFDFLRVFSLPSGAIGAKNGPFGVIFIPPLRVPCVNSDTFFDVSSIIVGSSGGIFFCLAQF